MATAVIMPKFGFTQETAELVRWLKQAGEAVEQGDPIAEVTTDKVNMEVEAPATGVLTGLRVREGETVPVTTVIAYIGAPGEAPPAAPVAAAATRAAEPALTQRPVEAPTGERPLVTPVAARVAADRGVDVSQLAGTGPGGRVTRRDVEAGQAAGKLRASPAARRAAREAGLPLAGISGSGPRYRIQAVDVQRALAPTARADAPPGRVIALAGMRRTIAARMQRSAQEAPHITFDADLDATEAEALRQRANAGAAGAEARVSLTAILVRVMAWALQRHPMLNSRLEGEHIYLLPETNIGVAVALEEGLIVPVVRQAGRKGLREIAAEIATLAESARAGKLRPEDVADGTFTISNLGMYGVDRFTAIINPPQSAILAVGRVVRRQVLDEADQPVIRSLVTITLSADHRVVDGAVAARFLSDLRAGFEHPDLLLV
ncbi:MAG: 2-oxo acid dehydrogenase subunit E2 [Anaerolineales bacterium]|nr:2-oxo acid dehydrogenase subunit E2 [Anaerolineales bacterium]